MLSILCKNNCLPQEIEEGNVEYKLKINSNDYRLTKLSSQMKWRLNEGKNKYGKYIAKYIIGIQDNGQIGDQTEEMVNESIQNLNILITKCNATILLIDKVLINNGSMVSTIAEITIIKQLRDQFINEMRICALGLTGHGKTTSISHVCYDHRDSGCGSGKYIIMKHAHEHVAGVTSCITQEILGINENNVVNYKTGFVNTWEKIVDSSRFIATLIDLPGSTKYIKTILSGLLSRQPHLCMIVFSLADCLSDTEIVIPQNFIMFVKLIFDLHINFIFLLTKNDIIYDKNLNVYEILQEHLKFIAPFRIKKFDPVDYNNFNDRLEIQCLSVSNVTGDGYDTFYKLLNQLYDDGYNNKFHTDHHSDIVNGIDNMEFIVNNIYMCNSDQTNLEKKNIIISGLLINGNIELNNEYLIGPSEGQFHYATVKSIHKKQIESKNLYCNETGSIEIEININVNLDDDHIVMITYNNLSNFTNSITILINAGFEHIKLNKQYTLFAGNVIESCYVSNINLNNPNNNCNMVTIICNNKKHPNTYLFKNKKCILKSEHIIIGTIIS
jgi:GTPase